MAPKISYITPEFYHTLLGFSYIPDTYNRRGLVNKDARYAKKDGYAAAAYNSLDLGFADMTSSAGYAEFHDNDKEFSLGLNLARGNWNLGGSCAKPILTALTLRYRPEARKKTCRHCLTIIAKDGPGMWESAMNSGHTAPACLT